MEIKTKFNIGDHVLIRGDRYEVSKMTIEEPGHIITVYGTRKMTRPGSEEKYTSVGDCDVEENVVADPGKGSEEQENLAMIHKFLEDRAKWLKTLPEKRELPMVIRIKHAGMFDSTVHEMLRSALEARKKYNGMRCTLIEVTLEG